jgi:hypothetical protein
MSLHIKLARTAEALTILAKSLMPQGKLAAAICREVINRLESYQESRLLSIEEQDILKLLKTRLLGLAAIESSRAPKNRDSLGSERKMQTLATFTSWLR